MSASPATINLEKIAEHIERKGYIILDTTLPAELSRRLLARCHDDDALNDLSRFRAAHIGRGTAKQCVGAIRGDLISWLDETDDTDKAYLDWMEALRSGVNQTLYLGLFDFECHYAIYGSGTGYAKHSDVLNGKKNRVLSTVFYLNESWQAKDGGELMLFDSSGETVLETVQPTFGKMIIFLSATFPHEVLTSRNTRRSIAGWFRISGS